MPSGNEWSRSVFDEMRIALLLFAFQTFALGLSAQAIPACEEITIAGPTEMTARGDSMILKVRSVTPLPGSVKFAWTVSAGTIVAGQGTDAIQVIAPSDSAVPVRATLQIDGLKPPCNEIASEEFAVGPPWVCGLAPDDWGKLKRDDERVRLLNAAHMFSRNPGTILIFLIDVAPNESVAEANRRAKYLKNFLFNNATLREENLELGPEQLQVAFARREEPHTYVYFLQPDKVPSFFKSFEAVSRPEDLAPVKEP